MDLRQQSTPLEVSAMVLGIISLAGCSCIYISIPLGALAMILALMSRGGTTHLGTKATLGLTLGALGIVVTIAFYGFAFMSALQTYGSMENLLRAAAEYMGMTYEEMMEILTTY